MEYSWMERFKWTAGQDVQQEAIVRLPPTTKKAVNATRMLQPVVTRKLKLQQDEAALPDIGQGMIVPPLLAWNGVTDTGMVRPHNEDSFSCLAFEKWSLFVVADGMGGHDAGEVASGIAVETVCREIREGAGRNDDPLGLVERAVQQANRVVKQEGMNRGSNMGTTLSLVFVADNTAYVANVGDSRVYWIENGSIIQITEDHSLVAKLAATGKLTKDEARNHPRSNLLYRTVGTDDTINVDTFHLELKKGDAILLCTDGLWGMLTDEEMHRVCTAEKDAKSASAKLVQMANDYGGQDNITAVVVKVL